MPPLRPCTSPALRAKAVVRGQQRTSQLHALAIGLGQELVERSTKFRDVRTSEQEASLCGWIQLHGGFIYEHLRLVANAPCGCRGVVTTAPVPLEAVTTSPLIVVPERLYMTTVNARELLEPLGNKRFTLSFWRDELPGALQLAVLLAHERQRGDDSFWAPYVRSLPDELPCAWAMSQRDLGAALEGLGALAECWEPAVQAARRGVQQRAEVAVHRYAKHLPGDIRQEDVVWALGQVLSRSFGREPNIALAPYIDLCNHRQGAPRPGGLVDDRDGQSYAFIESSSFGAPLALAPGDEIYVSYAADGGDPLAAFLNLGFVPPELLPTPGGTPTHGTV